MAKHLNSKLHHICFLFIFSLIAISIPFSAFADDYDDIDLNNHLTNQNLSDENFEVVYYNTDYHYTYRENSSLHDFLNSQGISLYANLPDRLPVTMNFLDFTGTKTTLFNTYIDIPIGDESFEGVYVLDIYFRKNCWDDEIHIYVAPYMEPDLANHFEWNSRVPSTINGIAPAQMYAERVQGFGFNEDTVTYDNSENLFYWGEELVDYFHIKRAFTITDLSTVPTLNFTLISSPLSNYNVYDYSGEDLQHTVKVCGQQQIFCYNEIFEYDAICIRTNLNDQYGYSNIGKYIYSYNENEVLGFSFNPYSNELIQPGYYYRYYLSEFFEEDINVYVCPHDINTIVSDKNYTDGQNSVFNKSEELAAITKEYNKLYKPTITQNSFHIENQTEIQNFSENVFEPIFNNKLIISMLILCLTVCFAAYILFGKRD